MYSFIYVASGHVARMGLGFGIMKIMAVTLGPAGLGEIGHFMSLVLVVSVLCGGGVTNGVIRQVSLARGRVFALRASLSSAFSYSLVASAAIFLVLTAAAKPLASAVLGNAELSWAIYLLAVSQFLIAFANVIIGASSGIGDSRMFAVIQIIACVIGLSLAWGLASKFGFSGAVGALVLAYSATFLPASVVWFCMSRRLRFTFHWRWFAGVKMYSGFTVMVLTTVVALPLVEVIIRQWIIESSGYAEAGLWQALAKMSTAYIGFFGVYLAHRFMPVLTRAESRNKWKVIARTMTAVAVLFLVFAGAFFGLREEALSILLSGEFAVLESYVAVQLVGDFFRVMSIVIGFVIVSSANTIVYIVAEFTQGVLLVFAVYYFGAADLSSVVNGYAVASAVYFLLAISGLVIWLRKNKGSCNAVLSE